MATRIPSNYIKRLEFELGLAQAEAEEMRETVRHLRRYLSSSKFQGFDYRDGASNSRVEVADVLHRLQGI